MLQWIHDAVAGLVSGLGAAPPVASAVEQPPAPRPSRLVAPIPDFAHSRELPELTHVMFDSQRDRIIVCNGDDACIHVFAGADGALLKTCDLRNWRLLNGNALLTMREFQTQYNRAGAVIRAQSRMGVFSPLFAVLDRRGEFLLLCIHWDARFLIMVVSAEDYTLVDVLPLPKRLASCVDPRSWVIENNVMRHFESMLPYLLEFRDNNNNEGDKRARPSPSPCTKHTHFRPHCWLANHEICARSLGPLQYSCPMGSHSTAWVSHLTLLIDAANDRMYYQMTPTRVAISVLAARVSDSSVVCCMQIESLLTNVYGTDTHFRQSACVDARGRLLILTSLPDHMAIWLFSFGGALIDSVELDQRHIASYQPEIRFDPRRGLLALLLHREIELLDLNKRLPGIFLWRPEYHVTAPRAVRTQVDLLMCIRTLVHTSAFALLPNELLFEIFAHL